MNFIFERVAPAKINLALHVTGRRDDGYHLLETLVAFTGDGDRLRAEEADRDEFAVSGAFASQVPSDSSNLVLRARDLMREHFGAGTERPVRLSLEKDLPVASGIGGGSSDAAAALKLLTQYWNIEAAPEALAQIALQLGADIPMCLNGLPLLARGIGDVIDAVAAFPELPLLLVNPGRPLATPDVFRSLMNRENAPLPAFDGKSLADLTEWLSHTRNDLEAPALALLPEISSVLGALRAQDALVARMSGSGATCFGVFETEEMATRAEAAIASRHPDWFVKASSCMPAAQETVNG